MLFDRKVKIERGNLHFYQPDVKTYYEKSDSSKAIPNNGFVLKVRRRTSFVGSPAQQ